MYAYIDRGHINNGANNGCHATGVQVTPSWLLPFSIGGAKFQFDGLLDYISSHGECVPQLLTQPVWRACCWDLTWAGVVDLGEVVP